MLPLRAYVPRFSLLLLLFFGILLPLAVAGRIAGGILNGAVFDFEVPLMLWIHRYWGAVLTPPAVVLHHIGKASAAVPLVLLFAAWLWRNRRRGYAVYAVLATLLPTLAMSSAKLFFARARPELWPRVVEEGSASFPSGHSTFAAALAAAVVLIYWPQPQRKYIAAAAAAFALAMGLSRIVLGVHYPTDVLVGWIIGTSIAGVLYLLMFRRLPGAAA